MVAGFNCRAAPAAAVMTGRRQAVSAACAGAHANAVAMQGDDAPAVEPAACAGSEVRIVRIMPQRMDCGGGGGHRQWQRELRGLVRTHFTAEGCSSTPQCDILRGPVAHRLIQFAIEQESDLILVSRRSNRAGRSALTKLVWQAPCSVWLVPEGAPARISRILAPIDFSEWTADSLRVALTLARRGGARCLPLHVYFNDAALTSAEQDAALRRGKQEAYEQLLSDADCEGVEVDPLRLVEGARTSHVLQRVAETQETDLIVMATRGRTRAAAALLSSVAEQMAGKTRAPLLIIKNRGDPAGVREMLANPKWHQSAQVRFN
jgi:nucleotide-binding universal stress UspA family protein